MTLTKSVDQMSILQGDRSKLKDLLRLRLAECGWSDQVRVLCRDVAKEESTKLNVDKMVQSVTPEARRLVPDAVKKELLLRIKAIISHQFEDDRS